MLSLIALLLFGVAIAIAALGTSQPGMNGRF
jgi:hypothetical protein